LNVPNPVDGDADKLKTGHCEIQIGPLRVKKGQLCLSQIKSGIRDAVRRGLGGKEYALPS
jgi:hypothetical protein